MVDHRDAVAHPFRLVDVVGAEQHRPALGAQLAQHVPDSPPRLRVQTRRGLVQQHQLRIPHQRASHRDALFLPAGQIQEQGVPLVGQAQLLDQRAHRRAVAVERAEQRQEFPHRQVIRQVRFLQRDANSRSQFLVRAPIAAQHLDIAGTGIQQAGDDLHRGSFAGAVRTEKPEALPLPHVQVEAVQRGHSPVALHQFPAT